MVRIVLRNNVNFIREKLLVQKDSFYCKGSLSFSFTEFYYWKFAHFIRISMIPVVFYKYLRIQMKCIQLNKIDFVGCGWECVAIWQVSVCSKYWHKSSVRHNYYHHMCGQIAGTHMTGGNLLHLWCVPNILLGLNILLSWITMTLLS